MKHWMSILFLLLAVLLTGCRQENLSEEFRLDDSIRMEIKGYTTFKYIPTSCQLGFNREKCEFRVHNDNMSDFFSVRLDDMPVGESQYVTGTVSWTTGDDLHTKKTNFQVAKINGDLVWLWSSDTRIALVIKFLE